MNDSQKVNCIRRIENVLYDLTDDRRFTDMYGYDWSKELEMLRSLTGEIKTSADDSENQEEKPMPKKFYNIEYTETQIVNIAIEAESEQEAYERFDNLINNGDLVYDRLYYFDSNTQCNGCHDNVDEAERYCDYVLTDKEYNEDYK